MEDAIPHGCGYPPRLSLLISLIMRPLIRLNLFGSFSNHFTHVIESLKTTISLGKLFLIHHEIALKYSTFADTDFSRVFD